MDRSPEKQKPLWIVLEGIDGSGKTTIAQKIQTHFQSQNIACLFTSEPTQKATGQFIRSFLKGEVSLSREEQIQAFLADRRVSVSEILRPAQDEGSMVVQDRYFYSTASYQGRDENDAREILKLNLEQGFPYPDHLFYLDISLEESQRRRADRGGTVEVFDSTENQRRIRKNYEAVLFSDPPPQKNIHRIAGDTSPEAVLDQILRILSALS